MGPDVAAAPPDCSQARAGDVVPGTTLAFQAVPGARLITYQVVAATGCWAKLDEDTTASGVADLSVDPSGRFLYASTRVADRETGVEAFRIDTTRGALEPIGRFVLDAGWFESPGPILATEDSVYLITRPIGTGYHGGLWRYAIDRASGRLQFRHLSFRPREPAFIEWWPSRSLLYVWMEDLTNGPPYVFLRALRIARDGDLSPGPEISIEWGQAESDPAGAFLWMTQGDTGFDTLDAFVPGAGGALTRASSTPWQHGPPAAHPSGRVLYGTSGARLDAFAVDPGSGAPRLATSAPAPPDGYRVAVDPSGQFAFVATASLVRGYRTDAAGTLREIGTVAGPGYAVALTRAPD